ncbi:MAG: hypothetical protein KDB80_01970 [Planctomycetes bacterium]|nr:hypothetical protein [Planctomycetota bacterium]
MDDLFGDATKVIVAKGKKVLTFEPKKDSFDASEFEKAVIGPSGNLRAPTIRTGKTWFVGFHEEAYAERLGG